VKFLLILIVPLLIMCVRPAIPVQVYFSPGVAPETHIIALIKNCTKTLDIAIYGFTDSVIWEAVLEAAHRGVQVRIVFDKREAAVSTSVHRFYQGPRMPGNIQMRVWNPRGLMHQKFCIGDKLTIITGSYNWTINAETINAENLVVITDDSIVQSFQEEFETLWTNSH